METLTALQNIKSENLKTGTVSLHSPMEIDILADMFTGSADAKFYIDPYGWLDAVDITSAASDNFLFLFFKRANKSHP